MTRQVVEAIRCITGLSMMFCLPVTTPFQAAALRSNHAAGINPRVQMPRPTEEPRTRHRSRLAMGYGGALLKIFKSFILPISLSLTVFMRVNGILILTSSREP
jgi:hypothetical protein